MSSLKKIFPLVVPAPPSRQIVEPFLLSVTSSLLSRWSALSYLYLLFTTGCGIAYVTLLAEYTTNDHWWRGLNTTGGQTFLADVFNTKLTSYQFGEFDLAAEFISKDYSTPATFIDVRPTEARRLMLAPIPLDVAITTIRANSLYENIFTISGHCWVDFDRRFEMAHTAKRQLRCALRQNDNAAVYLEALLRNVITVDLTQSAYGLQMNQIILTAVATTPEGSIWVSKLRNHTWGSVADEVSVWSEHGLLRYNIQWHNRFQTGIFNSIKIVNALGVSRSVTTSYVPFVIRGLAMWSSRHISSGLWNDMAKCVNLKCTMVRNMNNSMEAIGHDWDALYMGSTQTTGRDLALSFIGPLMNWDTFFVAPPASLFNLVASFQRMLNNRLQNDDAFCDEYQSLFEVDIDVVPPHWDSLDMLYYGGNPLCAPLAAAKPFVQMPFTYDDACLTQNRFAITFTRRGLLFSAWIMQQANMNANSVCSCSVLSRKNCYDAILPALRLVSSFP
ncbi:hypothetical protein LEN26_001320 [Aphanomyces euteiches]|nr:hypothetical protein AeMF1_015957 [Aphanomyces euteiches]KAH9161711.1 hypothetical protein LEN26_001320 [Aphanomyces euteiches]KAH9197470.1 hypothetical protein AeNC1_000577 [Aphanomyces euteiches]